MQARSKKLEIRWLHSPTTEIFGYKIRMKIEFSIIIPSYNRSESLKQLLEDLKNQNYDSNKFEVIVVNENGDPNYNILIKKFSKFLNIVFVKYSRKLGSSMARNVALRRAKGNFVIFLDDDVRVDRNFLVKCSEVSKKYDVFSCRIILYPHDPRPKIVRIINRLFLGKVILPLGMIFGGFELNIDKIKVVDHFPTTALVVKRDVSRDIRFDKFLGAGNAYLEDSDFTYSIHKKGYKLVFVPDFSVIHVRAEKGGNRLHDPSVWLNRKWLYYYWNHKSYFIKKHGGLFKLIPATYFVLLESIVLSILTRSNVLITCLHGWFDGIRNTHRL